MTDRDKETTSEASHGREDRRETKGLAREGHDEPDEQGGPDLVEGNVHQSHLQKFHQVPLEDVNQLQQGVRNQ